jgi:hypothetical protein
LQLVTTVVTQSQQLPLSPRPSSFYPSSSYSFWQRLLKWWLQQAVVIPNFRQVFTQQLEYFQVRLQAPPTPFAFAPSLIVLSSFPTLAILSLLLIGLIPAPLVE